MTDATFTPDAIEAFGPAEIEHQAHCTDCDWMDDNEGGRAAAEDHAREHRHVVNVTSTMATTLWPWEEAVADIAGRATLDELEGEAP